MAAYKVQYWPVFLLQDARHVGAPVYVHIGWTTRLTKSDFTFGRRIGGTAWPRKLLVQPPPLRSNRWAQRRCLQGIILQTWRLVGC
jgi:hypothetical protein